MVLLDRELDVLHVAVVVLEPRHRLEQLLEGPRSRVAFLGDVWGTSNVDVHMYQCTYCGSIELFRDGGPIDHPLPGSAEAGPGPT